MSKYGRVLTFAYGQPWAILPAKLLEIRELLQLRADGVILSDEEIAARVGAGPARRDTSRAGAVAVIPVYGTITHRADMLTQMSGGTSVERLTADLRSAVADESVRGIVMLHDSPGGGVFGLEELAKEIRDARAAKPIVAQVQGMCCSASYWLASAASEVVVSPSSEVGSVGVYAMHEDVSEMLAAAGVKVEFLSAGEGKTDGNPYQPLTEKARAELMKGVNEFYSKFVRDVARGRGISGDAIRSEWGARVVRSKEAVERKMADKIDTLDATIRRLLGRGAASVGQRGAEVEEPTVLAEEPPPAPPAPPVGPTALQLAEMEAAAIRARTL